MLRCLRARLRLLVAEGEVHIWHIIPFPLLAPSSDGPIHSCTRGQVDIASLRAEGSSDASEHRFKSFPLIFIHGCLALKL